ncbi:T7SS effector LXG polymorphic toxin [Metabacillus litoralis]|uniref:T7SS effector LXG polymorphic toxin n=1 Tax=Metabacillus litoralis TaxID=152268 RepID=UPI00203C7DA9|nr:T7SS effector LXG polymorphic toxin [Metabacillus litoralis]MCM3163202.1 LXG domain-containing protein [Metabacillus litoralis]
MRFFEGVKHKLVSEKLGADTVVHSSFLEDELSKSERQADDMVDQYRRELNSIFQKINDILSLQVFSTSDFHSNMEDAQMNREKTTEAVERVDQELLNEYMYSIYEQDNARALFQALRDATSTGVRIQPISFDAEAFRASEIYQMQGGAKFHTDNYLRLKNKELGEMGIQTNTRYEGNGNHDEFDLAEFSGYHDLLRARYGFDPVTGLELRLDEQLNYAMLNYIRFGSRPVVEDRENHEGVKLTKEEFEAIQEEPKEIVNVIDEMGEYTGDYYVYGNGLIIRVFGNVREKVNKIPPDRVGGAEELDTFFEGTPLAILETVVSPKNIIKKSINNIVKKQFSKDVSKGAGEIGWRMSKGGGVINGRKYSQHALERMAPDTPEVKATLTSRAIKKAEELGYKPQTKEFSDFIKKYVDPRNIPPSVIEDAIMNTKKIPGNRSGTFVHDAQDVKVIINEAGDVITVIPK